jgi:hypothetical protein
MTIRRLVFAAIVFTFFGTELSATTYPAASCNESDVQAAYTTEQLTPADGDIITIPAGSCTWSSGLSISPSNSLTIQGAGAKSATDGGASTTGSDLTIITHTVGWFRVTTAAGKSFRFTGVNAVEQTDCGGSCKAAECTFCVYGFSTAVRIDHNHFVTSPERERMVGFYGAVQGVMDHNYSEAYQNSQTIIANNGTQWLRGGVPDTTIGNFSWADDSYWGSSKFIYFEDNRLVQTGDTGLFVSDCSAGGRMVVRYNTLMGQAGVEDHEGLHADRGCRAKEVYKNNYTAYPAWQQTTAYLSKQRITDPSNHMQETSGACTSGSSTPSWNDSGSTTGPDGSCTWTDRGIYYSSGAAGGRAGGALIWGNALVGSSQIFTPTLDRQQGVNGIWSPQGPGECGNGYSGYGWQGTVDVTTNTTVTLHPAANPWGVTIQFPVTSPVSWPYSLSNPYIYINGVQHTVSRVSDATHLTLGEPATNATNVPYYVPSVWDGNADTTGYPCIDQAGRGKGDLLTGLFSDGTRINATTGTLVWPHMLLDPVYLWNNTNTGQQNVVGQCCAVWRNNRDLFYDGMSYALSSLTQTSATSPFNGTLVSTSVLSWSLASSVLTLTVSSTAGFSVGEMVNTNFLNDGGIGLKDVTAAITAINSGASCPGGSGVCLSMASTQGFGASGSIAQGTVSSLGVGVGITTNRPRSCTAGVDPANGNIAAPGVAYWATDAANLNGDTAHPGVLYACTATNTWTPYYSPYTYPHPLTQGGAPNPPNPPSNLSATPQ